MANEQSDAFFQNPILNSPYEEPTRHWHIDKDSGQPTGQIDEGRRVAEFLSPIARARAQTVTSNASQAEMDFGLVKGADSQTYDNYQLINLIRREVAAWRRLSETQWGVTPETAQLLNHWRTFKFSRRRPFFCQVEAAEVVIWFMEVARRNKKRYRDILAAVEKGNMDADDQLYRLALKLATGAGKTTVMAMLIAWQTINAVRHPASDVFTNGFLVIAPGLTVKDRLRVLQPNDPDAYYEKFELVPRSMLGDLRRAKIVITNFQQLQQRETVKISAGTRRLLEGRTGDAIKSLETEGQMLQRVCGELLGFKRLIVLNDEAHHCYRKKDRTGFEEELDREEKKSIEDENKNARLWISGLEALRRKIRGTTVIDFSATPFFLSGSGYREGTLFPWTISDFSLMDAIECGIVKLPRVPVSDKPTDDHDDMPMFREIWQHIKRDPLMSPPKPKKGEKKGDVSPFADPAHTPPKLVAAIDNLYRHYEETDEMWKKAQMEMPPCFIFVCQNTAVSRLVYDFVSGYKTPGGIYRKAHCPLFSNFHDDGTPKAKPATILVDSRELDSGEALSKDFIKASVDEVAAFKRELAERGRASEAEKLDASDILREVMNTVGKPGKLGGEIRCVVSVSMLTEGWDASNVTHILGVRAFGTQLLCEQVIGRALRRPSYETDDNGLLPPQYADIFGIPFSFIGRAVQAKPTPPPKLTEVFALDERRDAQIEFPRLVGYHVKFDDERIKAVWDENSDYVLDHGKVGPYETRNEGIVGMPQKMTLEHLRGVRNNTIAYNLAMHLLETKFKDGDEAPKFYLFGQLKAIVRDWIENHLVCNDGTFPAQILYPTLAATACDRIAKATIREDAGPEKIVGIKDPFNEIGSTEGYYARTAKKLIFKTSGKCHLNYAICDSQMEMQMCQVLEDCELVEAWVKNDQILGLSIPYEHQGVTHQYIPDFIVRLSDARKTMVLLETKGVRDEPAKEKAETAKKHWVPAVNNMGKYGHWAFKELDNWGELALQNDLENFLKKVLAEAEME